MRPPPVHTLSRTISGSFISNISKQATPAPSDIDSEHGSQIYLDFPLEPPSNLDWTLVNDGTDEIGTGHLEYPTAHSAKQLGVALQTPSMTPEPLEDGPRRDQRKRIERLTEERDEARRELEKKVSTLLYLFFVILLIHN